MLNADYGDLVDLRERLKSFEAAADRRLVPVLGSGLSNSVLPDINGLTALFRSALAEGGRHRFDEAIAPIAGTALAYQNAASLVKRQAGDPTMARVIRQAVLVGCPSAKERAEDLSRDIESCRDLEREAIWDIPIGYQNFARYYAALEGRLRGPIITTNFDPLIEIALRDAGLHATAVPIPMDSAPSLDQLREHSGIPVIHIHGYWTSNATLNTIPQLTKRRDSLQGLLRGVLMKSIVLVIGYAGWEDAFMRSLAERVAEVELLDAEMLWAAYADSPTLVLNNETLATLDGAPGFTLYLSIDGHAIFAEELERTREDDSLVASPYGYSRLPLRVGASAHNPARFVEGGQPTWADAALGKWPLLRSTTELSHQLNLCLEKVGGGGVVAIGPLGEGKSLAIRQVGLV